MTDHTVPPIGMRMIKTAAAVLICLLVSMAVDREDMRIYSSIAAAVGSLKGPRHGGGLFPVQVQAQGRQPPLQVPEARLQLMGQGRPRLRQGDLAVAFLGHQVLFRQDSQHPGDGGAGHLEDPGHLGGADRRLSLGQLANGQQIPQMRLAQFHEMERLLPPGGAGLPLVRNDGYFRSGIRRRPRSRRRRSSRPFRDAGCRCPCLRWPQRPPGR